MPSISMSLLVSWVVGLSGWRQNQLWGLVRFPRDVTPARIDTVLALPVGQHQTLAVCVSVASGSMGVAVNDEFRLMLCEPLLCAGARHVLCDEASAVFGGVCGYFFRLTAQALGECFAP